MNMRILVTGVNGFVGQHLVRELVESGHEVIGTGQDKSLTVALRDLVTTYLACDLTDREQIARLPLDTVDAVINLAGIAQVGSSFGKEKLYEEINVKVHTTLAERVHQLGASLRILAISTGAVYDSSQPMPIREDGKLIDSGSPYAYSKVLMEQAMHHFMTEGMDIVIARPFNHTGPGQPNGFLLPDLAKQVLRGRSLQLAPNNTERDFTDVRDVVRAYRLLATHSGPLTHDIYNVCSGRPVSRDRLVQLLLNSTGQQDLPIEIDRSLLRPHDPAVIYGDNHRLMQETGWEPKITLEQTIDDYLAWEKTA